MSDDISILKDLSHKLRKLPNVTKVRSGIEVDDAGSRTYTIWVWVQPPGEEPRLFRAHELYHSTDLFIIMTPGEIVTRIVAENLYDKAVIHVYDAAV